MLLDKIVQLIECEEMRKGNKMSTIIFFPIESEFMSGSYAKQTHKVINQNLI